MGFQRQNIDRSLVGVQGDLAFRRINSVARIKMHQRLGGHGFARSGFPHQPHHFALVQRKVDIVDGGDQPLVGAKLERQVLYVDEGRHLLLSE